MTSPNPLTLTDDEKILRKRWLDQYLKTQKPVDTKIRTLLIQAASDAQEGVSALETSSTFSSGVKTAQLNLVMEIVKEVLNDTFKQFGPILQSGSKSAALGAATAFTNTDSEYLRRVFEKNAGSYNNFIAGERNAVQTRVATIVTKMYGFEYPLSGRVYRTRVQATSWVRNMVSRQLIIGTSAKDIAKSVRGSIRPNTPGGVGYAAMRLGRTEINNAFHATAIDLAKNRPWVEGMVWHTSHSHKSNPSGKIEVCESLNGRSFSVNETPIKPHPQCMCYITPEVESLEVFVRHLTAGQYRDWMGNAA